MVAAAVTWYGNWAPVGGKERTRPRSLVEDRKSGGRRGEDKQLSTGSLLLSVVLLFSLVFPFPLALSLSPPLSLCLSTYLYPILSLSLFRLRQRLTSSECVRARARARMCACVRVCVCVCVCLPPFPFRSKKSPRRREGCRPQCSAVLLQCSVTASRLDEYQHGTTVFSSSMN